MEFISEREWKEGVGQEGLPFLWGTKHMCMVHVHRACALLRATAVTVSHRGCR